MPIFLRAFLIVISLAFLAFVCVMVRREKLLLKYYVLWLVLGLLGVIIAAFPEAVFWLSERLGFVTPANLVFVSVIGVLLIVCLIFSRALTRQAIAIKDLVQELSILKAQVDGQASGGGISGAGGESDGAK